jgi:CheY-like chemotaxis protein
LASRPGGILESAKDREAYKSIGKVCRHGREVVKSLVHFAQPTLVTQAPFEMNSLIQEVCALLESITKNQVQIVQSLIEEPLWINGNAGDVNHILVNLGINSLDAMPDRGNLTFRTVIRKGNWVEVSIEDNGIGMTSEVLAHALEPFFTTKDESTGAGLGLSMTYGVVKAHCGTIDITSQPGQGTTVKLRFPRIPAPVRVETVKVPALPLRLRKVLLVDDEEDVRFLMGRMLKKASIGVVETAASGEEALEKLLPGVLPDVLILDQNMPGMTGVQLMAKVRDRYPDMPILFSSGQPDIESWEILKQPRVAVISKPFTVDEIQAKLAQFSTNQI